MEHLKSLAAQYWYLGLVFTAVWSALSIVWSVRVERLLKSLRAVQTNHAAKIVYLQRDDASAERTPTSGWPVAIPRLRGTFWDGGDA